MELHSIILIILILIIHHALENCHTICCPRCGNTPLWMHDRVAAHKKVIMNPRKDLKVNVTVSVIKVAGWPSVRRATSRLHTRSGRQTLSPNETNKQTSVHYNYLCMGFMFDSHVIQVNKHVR